MTFAAMPGVPSQGLTDAEFRLFNAIKQNIEQLTGQSGEAAFNAVLAGQFTVQALGDVNATDVKISGQAYNISGAGQVPTIEDFLSLANNVQQLVYDVKLLRDALNTVITQAQG